MVSLLFSDAVHSAPVLLCCIIARKNREVQASQKGIAALHSHGVPAAVCAHKRFSRVDLSFSRRAAAFGCKRSVFDRVSVCCRLGNYLRGCGTGAAACKKQVFVEKKIPACNNTDMFGCVCGSVCKRYTLDAGRRRRSDGGTMPFCGDIA